MSEAKKETRCPFCGLEMTLWPGAFNQPPVFSCDTRDCPIWLANVAFTEKNLSEAWCFQEMDRIRARMTGAALDTAAMIGSWSLLQMEVQSLERRLTAAKAVFVRMHSAIVSDDIERSARRFDDLVNREIDATEPEPKGSYCDRCLTYFDDDKTLMNHAGCRPWYENTI